MSGQAGALSPADWEGFRHRLAIKVRYHVGISAPMWKDWSRESLARFQRALNSDAIRKPESIGAFLSGICNNVISEYRRGLWRDVPMTRNCIRNRRSLQRPVYSNCGTRSTPFSSNSVSVTEKY